MFFLFASHWPDYLPSTNDSHNNVLPAKILHILPDPIHRSIYTSRIHLTHCPPELQHYIFQSFDILLLNVPSLYLFLFFDFLIFLFYRLYKASVPATDFFANHYHIFSAYKLFLSHLLTYHVLKRIIPLDLQRKMTIFVSCF